MKLTHRSLIPALIISGSLLLLAFMAYPGSTYYDATTTHYAFFKNTISETGMTENYRQEPLVWSRLFFSAFLISAGATIGIFIAKQSEGIMIQILAIATTTCLILIAFFPTNLARSIHNYLFFAFITCIAASFLAIYKSNYSRLFLTSGLILLAYMIFLILEPSTTISPLIHSIHVIIQKIIVSLLFLTVFLKEKRINLIYIMTSSPD